MIKLAQEQAYALGAEVASHVLGINKEATILGALNPLNWIEALTSGTEAGKKTSEAAARADAAITAVGKSTKAKNKFEYYFGENSVGPIETALSSLRSRNAAAMAENPVASALIPLYSYIKGGKLAVPSDAVMAAIDGKKTSIGKTAKGYQIAAKEIGDAAEDAQENHYWESKLNPDVFGELAEIRAKMLRDSARVFAD